MRIAFILPALMALAAAGQAADNTWDIRFSVGLAPGLKEDKTTESTDSFGNLPNMNAGEVAIRLPGIYGELDAGGNLSGFTVRGMGSGLMGTIAQGFMFGTGSAIAHRAVGAVMGGSGAAAATSEPASAAGTSLRSKRMA